MARAQLIRPEDPYKFKQGDWVLVKDPVTERFKIGVIHSRGGEEEGDDTVYSVALRVEGGFAIPKHFSQRNMQAAEDPRDPAEWQRAIDRTNRAKG